MSQHLRACLLHLYPACCCLPPLILFIMGPVLLSSLPQREGENSTSELLHRTARALSLPCPRGPSNDESFSRTQRTQPPKSDLGFAAAFKVWSNNRQRVVVCFKKAGKLKKKINKHLVEEMCHSCMNNLLSHTRTETTHTHTTKII